jgi:hypothetical protein
MRYFLHRELGALAMPPLVRPIRPPGVRSNRTPFTNDVAGDLASEAVTWRRPTSVGVHSWRLHGCRSMEGLLEKLRRIEALHAGMISRPWSTSRRRHSVMPP